MTTLMILLTMKRKKLAPCSWQCKLARECPRQLPTVGAHRKPGWSGE